MAGPGGPPPPADRLPRVGERAGPRGCGGWRGFRREGREEAITKVKMHSAVAA